MFNRFKKEKKVNLFSDEDIQVLKQLGENDELHITRPDKGRGIIILNKKDYLDKMETILSDSRIFENCPSDDPKLKILRTEDKVNRFIRKLKDKGSITENEYKNLYVCGSSPSVLYGLPKVHKLNIPLRPIVSSVNTPMYKLAKFIIPEIANLSKNEYVLENSKDLINSVSHLVVENSHFMCSFDVESLFTNIPVKETINIIVNTIYDNDNDVRNMSRNDFKRLLELITEDNYIIFDNKFVRQKEGLAMGNPVSAVFANIFMSYHEKRWLDLCPADFKPVLYKRYVDDTYMIFKSEAHVELFFNYLNMQHDNIKFTLEKESEGRIPFLDMLIERTDGRLDFSIFRKPTFTGLGMNFLSECYHQYKINSIRTLVYRAFNLSS